MILVPIKDLRNAKQRLSPLLTPDERFALAHAMVEDVFDALSPFASDPGVTVVSGDPWASQQAKTRRFTILVDDRLEGETEAIAFGTSFCLSMGAGFSVVFPADIPLLTSEEVRAVLEGAPKVGCFISPAADSRGTNAILRRPAGLIPLKFGNDSFQPHLSAARATGHEVIVREFPGIGLDVDRPEDLGALIAQPVRTRAQRLLVDWSIGERLKRASNAHA